MKVVCMLLIIGVLMLGCGKICHHDHYGFKATAQFYPENDSIAVGDTIWFTSSVPVKNTDTISNQIINYGGASNFSTDINFNSIEDPLKISEIEGAIDSFSFISMVGSLKENPFEPKGSLAISYSEGSVYYQNSFAFVALKKGIYAVTVVDIENSYKRCAKAYVSLTLSNINKHQEFLKITYYPGSPFGDTIPEIEQTHTYCFKVY